MLRRLLGNVVLGVSILGVAAAAYWAGTTAALPPQLPSLSDADQTYVVADGVVSRSFQVPVSVSWAGERTLLFGTDGVVTSVPHVAGNLAVSGEVIATVDLEPVVVATGAVPMFRALREGVEGPDVAQFQELLRAGGFLKGAADGHFAASTVQAAMRWQRSIGAKAGVVSPGSILFVQRLPARLQVLAAVGQRTSIGSEFVRVLADQPDFTATVGASQRAELATGMEMAVSGLDGNTWPGKLGAFAPRDDGRFSIGLTGVLCGTGCAAIPIDGETALSGEVVTIPPTKGPVVPRSAIVEDPAGELTVALANGTRQRIQVVAEADGFAVIAGLAAGAEIQLPVPPP